MEKASKAKGFDFEAVEAALRVAVLSAGAKVLEKLVAGIGCGRRSEPFMCSCGAWMNSNGLKEKTILTILGEIKYSRSMYECPACGAARFI